MCEADLDVDISFSAGQWLVARKDRPCFTVGCDINIRVGDRYHQYVSAVRGERPDRWSHCARCWLIIESLWAQGISYVQFGLDCDVTWRDSDDLWDKPEPEHLAFLTADEAQLAVKQLE